MSELVIHPAQMQALSSPTTEPDLNVFAVVVIYKLLLADSPTLRTLYQAARLARSPRFNLHVRVVDNTPGGQDPAPLPPGFEYCASPENPGLARPYNEAWRVAERDGYRWFLTLDQDTDLPEYFFQALAGIVQEYDHVESVAAIVPHIVDRGRLIFPMRFIGGFLPKVVSARTSGILGKHASAPNSASLLRVSALRDVNGYDEAFPLHHSDVSLYLRLDKAGKCVVVANEILVNHEFAIMDRGNRMSGDRYRSMLADERAFYDLHMGFLGRLERMVRLVGRVAKDLLRGQGGAFTSITLKEIWLRLITRRKDRLARLVPAQHLPRV